jgi:putative ABC transport system permease protein
MRNVRRHLGRSLLLLLVITAAVAIVAALYLVVGSARADLEAQVDTFGANIVIAPRTEQLPLSYGGVQLGGLTYETQPLHMSDVAVIRTIEDSQNISRVAPKLVEQARVGDVALLVVGVDWEEELGLKQWWTIEGRAPVGEREILAGSRVLGLLGVSVGDTVVLQGEEFTIVGLLEPTGTQEDDLLFLDLGATQALWQRGDEVSFIEVAAFCSSCPIEIINAEIAAALPQARVSAVLKAMESREILVGQFTLFGVVLSFLMVLVGCLIVLTSTLGAVRERRGEIGIFRAMGYRGRHVLRIVLTENMALALVAGSIGIALAWGLAGPLARNVAGVVVVQSPSLVELVVALGASLLVVLLASLYPAWQATRLSPLLAMRRL